MKYYISNNNSKLKKSGISSFGIPAYKSVSGFFTCPGANECITPCYARHGAYIWSNVSLAYEKRLSLTLSKDFIPVISSELKNRKIKILRIHDSGDYYSKKYLEKWLSIIRMFPEITFYSYTKIIPLFKKKVLPTNFMVIYSLGGKYDHLINTNNERHAKIFLDKKSLEKEKYIDASSNDLNALTDNLKVGLIYHGPKKDIYYNT